MKTFLNVIAKKYLERYTDISKLTFIMPNKRSGSFLLKAFSDMSESATVAPRILTISDFVAHVARNVTDSRIDLLFRLFVEYRKLQKEGGEETRFEKFTSWGETIISDFNEIDMQMADPKELFKSVYDLNAIKTDFLSDEQKKVMVEYFGYSPDSLAKEAVNFWKKYTPSDKTEGGSAVEQKFYSLWQLLYPLYTNLKESLQSDGLTTTGGAFREAAERIADEGYEPFPGEKIIFVGFNALSVAESTIFRGLKEMMIPSLARTAEEYEPKADYLWDMAPETVALEDGQALKFVNINSKKSNFPAPGCIKDALRATVPLTPPEIKVVSVPSNVMQAKVVAKTLADLYKGDEQEIKEAKVAVVLPDENMLLPMLYSLPPSLSRPNLTMGFPLKHTPVISFATLLRRIHAGARAEGDASLFYFEDVKDFLAHPYSRLIFDAKEADKYIRMEESQRRIMVSSKSLSCLGPDASFIFRVFPENTPPLEVADYILHILTLVKKALEDGGKNSYITARVEKVFIGTYFDSLIKLKNCMGRYSLPLTPRDVFALSGRLMAGENVVFDGRPLAGLQIMGVLETRCLDFDRVFVLNMNEKVMPRVGRNSTFIPNIIRSAYGLPPANYQEEIFAYYFYRLLGRCTHAFLTYDSRASENRTPGPSRYLLQLKYLVENLVLKEAEARFNLPVPPEGAVVVEKDPEIMSYIDRYTLCGPDGGTTPETKKFSASSLEHYFACPLRFLYGDLLEIYEDREKTETIDAIDMGLIVHRAIEHLYFPPDKRGRLLTHPILLTPDFLRGLLSEKRSGSKETRIEKEARESVLKVHFGVTDEKLSSGALRGSAAVIYPYIVHFIRNIIEADLAQAPLRLWGSEIKTQLPYRPEPGGPTVFLKLVIDRLDQAGGEGDDAPFRIVDYKTGKVKLKAESLEDVFSGASTAKNIFQLIFYAEALVELVNSLKKEPGKLPAALAREDFAENLRMVIYKVLSLPDLQEGVLHPCIGSRLKENKRSNADTSEPRPVETLGRLREVEKEEGVTFRQLLDKSILGILDADTPFSGEPSDDLCKYCPYRLRCEMVRARREDDGEISCPSPK